MSTTINWEEHSNGTLLTGTEAAHLVSEVSGSSCVPSTWRYYQTKWRAQGLIPAPKKRIGSAALYDQGEVIYWATHRLGRGARVDLQTPAEDTAPPA